MSNEMCTTLTTPADGELLPCSTCGNADGSKIRFGASVMIGLESHGHCTLCEVCGTIKRAERSDFDGYVAAWNRRATPSPGKAPEPVAWMRPDELAKAKSAPYLCRVEPTKRMADFVPLYASPGKAEAERGFTRCVFLGEPPQPFTNWNEWALHPGVHADVTIRAATVADWEGRSEPVAYATDDFSDVVPAARRRVNSKAFCVPLYVGDAKSIALPERKPIPAGVFGLARKYAQGWNDCLDAIQQERDKQ